MKLINNVNINQGVLIFKGEHSFQEAAMLWKTRYPLNEKINSSLLLFTTYITPLNSNI
jgi:hypothetical protein